ncbi:hypothetical protein [Kosakonia sp.]|uniref:hypothetical protein n=1 Tax=Kosakonia sp. TaxID=1916651 RepID=UPI0028AE83AA|nr:hypothetical protein [Kosakonia sp.]
MDIESIIAAANRAQQAEDAGPENYSSMWPVDALHRNSNLDSLSVERGRWQTC